jgi:ATP-dependent DNA ligase
MLSRSRGEGRQSGQLTTRLVGSRSKDRRAELERIVKGADAILFSEALAAEGELVFRKASELGCEGVISKRVGSAYWSGRCRTWTKVRNPALLTRSH